MNKKCTAIVLLAGSGSRMGTDTKKQFLPIKGKPMAYYSIKAFQDCDIINEIIITAAIDDIDYVRDEIVGKYGFTKVRSVVKGGRERYNSVMNGLMEAAGCDYVFIHDGARPFVTDEIIKRAYETLTEWGTAVVGMPVKDTIKIVDDECNVVETPDRSTVWQVQTPQCFEYDTVMEAYNRLESAEVTGELDMMHINVTDDAMVVETFLNYRVKLVVGSYTNIKVTTPEDLMIAEAFVQED